ncbi:MAG: hypothetical protein B6I20_10120 [Bacteroidetes bacterium 4572_117]|nr:MAG: hypothetical protein B6I20_10120 [Bacteroidetes bacterium 4572_117]
MSKTNYLGIFFQKRLEKNRRNRLLYHYTLATQQHIPIAIKIIFFIFKGYMFANYFYFCKKALLLMKQV